MNRFRISCVLAIASCVLLGGSRWAEAQEPSTQPMPIPVIRFFPLSKDSKPWHPQPAPAAAPLVHHRCRIVDYGDDFTCFREGDQFLLAGTGWSGRKYQQVKTGLDLDGDGHKNDSLSYVDAALADPLPGPASWDWDTEGTGARFYTARASFCLNTGDDSRSSIGENGGPNVGHSIGCDDLNMMGWTPTNNRHLQPVMGAGLWLWKKEDFLNGGDKNRVFFDQNSILSLHLPRYCHENQRGRMLVQDEQGYWLSAQEFTGGHGQDHQVKPTATKWARFDIRPPDQIWFDPQKAKFEDHVFTDIRAAGHYWRTFKFSDVYDLKIGAFEMYATIDEPQRPSRYIRMKEIKAGDLPPFYISACEVPYTAWQKVHRWSVSSMYTIQPGYYYLGGGAGMGSMMCGDQAHSSDEPATELSWLDALAWCNALSELEGFEPCYYADPECRQPLRQLRERFFYRDPAKVIVPKVFVKWAADGYRLPTLAEWKAACGTMAGLQFQSSDSTRPVGSGPPNANGLYDMLGNVWEWIWDAGDSYDHAAAKSHLLVGGDFHSPLEPASAAASASPYGDTPFHGGHNIGFRPVRREAGSKAPPATAAPAITKADLDGKEFGVPAWSVTRDFRTAASATKPVLPDLPMVEIPPGDYALAYKGRTISMQISPFLIAKTETTFAQWKKVRQWADANGYVFNYLGDMGSMARGSENGRHTPNEPVTNLSWDDMVVWCNALSEMEGRRPVYYTDDARTQVLKESRPLRLPMLRYDVTKKTAAEVFYLESLGKNHKMVMDWSADGYRLPTAPEWGRAYRGDTDRNFYWGREADPAQVWCRENSNDTTRPVGQKPVNPFGLYDMAGNVSERTMTGRGSFDPLDIFDPKEDLSVNAYRRALGGSFYIPLTTHQGFFSADTVYEAGSLPWFDAYPHLGFRVVRCPPAPTVQIRDRTYYVIGPLTGQVRALKGKTATLEGEVVEDRYFKVTGIK